MREPADLCRLLGLPADLAERTAATSFSLRAPMPYIERMQRGNPLDPLLLQVWPDIAEELPPPEGYTADPVGDLAATQTPGLLKKYDGRALLVTTGSCAIHCRYCFRREFPYNENATVNQGLDPALAAIAADASIREVIISGGDPLTLTDEALEALLQQIAEIPHVSRLRLHTRLPIVIPSRITTRLVEALAHLRLKTVVVIHANHANEIDEGVANALLKMQRAGAMLFNQSVLLRRVNDSADALAALSNRLIDCGVTPYYLHTLDRVIGAAHFETEARLGEKLIHELRKRLPGYAVPRLVREEAGAPHKVVLA